jgi:hypothetical protein
LAEVAENCLNSVLGSTWVGERGGGRSLPSANPDNVAAGGATDAGCGEGGGSMEQITAHSNPYSSFSLSFFPLCIRRGFDEKIPHVAVQHNNFKWIRSHVFTLFQGTII